MVSVFSGRWEGMGDAFCLEVELWALAEQRT